MTILVTGGIKLGKEVFVEEGVVGESRNFTYLGQTFDVFPGFGSTAPICHGSRSMCSNWPPASILEKVFVATYCEEKKCK